MVWLRWEGPAPKTLVLLNELGARNSDGPHDASSVNSSIGSPDASVTPGLIRSRHASLSLSDSRPLRDETLADSLFSIIPGLRSWAPARTLAARERRWLSRGTLTRPNLSAEQGWAIHEEVRFDGSSQGAGDRPRRASDPPSAGVP
jgi:hypothetical protein